MGVVLFTLPLLGDITLGTVLGVVGTIASFLLAPKPKQPTIKAMTSAWGENWPIVYNSFRLAGKCIQAGNVTKHNTKSKKGGPTYSQTFALGFCEGVRQIGRIWADNNCIYDPRPITPPPDWQANFLYGVGDQIQPLGITAYYFIATINGESGSSAPTWNQSVDGDTRDGDVVWIAAKYSARTKIGQQYNFTMRIYPGDETQLADSALEEQVGTGNQPAYRGLCYVVFESFDLSKYGNRIPNIEAEILTVPSYEIIEDYNVLTKMWVDPTGGNLYSSNFDAGTVTLTKLNLTSNTNVATATTSGTFADVSEARGSYSGNFCAMYVFDGTDNFIWKINQADLTTIAAYPWTPTGFAATDMLFAAPVFGVSGDGTLCAGLYTDGGGDAQWLMLMEMTGGTYTWTNLTVLGSLPSMSINALTCLCFDGAGHLWFGDEDCNAWLTAISGHTPTAMTSFSFRSPSDNRVTQYLSYAPATDELIFWLDDAAGTFTHVGIFLRWNATTHAATTAEFSWDYNQNPTIPSSLDITGWNGRGLAAIRDISGSDYWAFDVVNTLTGATSNFPLTFWGIVPTGDDVFRTVALGAGPDEVIASMNFNDTDSLVSFQFASQLTLADICADVSGRIGLGPADYDYSGLTSVIPDGAALLTRDLARSFIESLQPAYFFDVTDIGGQVVGSLRSNDVLGLTIGEADLAASPAGTSTVSDKIASVRNDDLETPQDLSIQFYDILHDYQQGSQQARRSKITQYSSGRNSVSVPVVMNSGEANNAALRGLYLLWVERTQRKFVLPPQYLGITPTDVISVVRNNKNNVVRVTKATLQPNWTIEIESISEDLGTYSIQVPMPVASLTNGAQTPATINPVSSPELAVMDTAQLRLGDTAPGVYVAASATEVGAQYDTVAVQESQDDSVFNTVASLLVEATIGTVAVALPDWPRYTVFDRTNSLTLSLLGGALGNAAESDIVDNFTNLAWLSNGEILQFATATLNGDGTYTLTNLLRGRFGTEQYVGTHASNETFVFLDANVMQTVEYPASDIGATRYWRGLNDAPSNPASPTQTLVMATNRLKPYAPTFIRGSRDTPGNLTITGKRRARWRGTPLWTPPETDMPVTVQIDILNGSTVVRTLTSTLSANGSGVTSASGFTAYYAEADQVIDFGSKQASVSVMAYALNALVGRGYGGAETI